MIWESHYWKEELAKDLRHVRRQIQKGVDSCKEMPSERTIVAIEKFTFTGAYIVRKLAEAKKLSDEIENSFLCVRSYARINHDRSIDFLNWHCFEEFYDLGAPREARFSLREFCNQLIHSFVFVTVLDDNTSVAKSFLFNSDRTKDEAVFEFELEELFMFIEAVIQDDIVHVEFNRLTGKLLKFSKHGRHPVI